jgi:hypothetical protein
MGIEPTSEAWEASILPLYDARSGPNPNAEYHRRSVPGKNAKPSSPPIETRARTRWFRSPEMRSHSARLVRE